MSEAEFTSLRNDIKAHGQRVPIVVYAGQVLDGWHRYRACQELEIAPQFEGFTGDDPNSFVFSLNVERRHLQDGHRAMIAAELATLAHGGDRQRSSKPPNGDLKLTQAEAAKIMGVSARNVQRAKAIARHGTAELVDAVKAGTVTLAAAERRVRSRDAAPPSVPPKPAAPPPRRVTPRRALDQRVETLLGDIDAGIAALDSIRTDEPYSSSQAATWCRWIQRRWQALAAIERGFAMELAGRVVASRRDGQGAR
jgi:hypothetical protein